MTDENGKRDDKDSELHCNFCDKSKHEVKKLISGSSAYIKETLVYICDECIGRCLDIIREDSEEGAWAKKWLEENVIEIPTVQDLFDTVKKSDGSFPEDPCEFLGFVKVWLEKRILMEKKNLAKHIERIKRKVNEDKRRIAKLEKTFSALRNLLPEELKEESST